jgi:ATP-dependent RNA helicase DDX31/DBP7
MGGESTKHEKEKLRKGCVILICTPGRLLYHLKNTQAFKLDNLQYLIFDEADRILDMGFEKDMNECLEIIRQKSPNNFIPLKEGEETHFLSDTIKVNLVSATMSPGVDLLGAKLMKEYVKVGF